MEKFLLVGLGNIGSEYASSRHNIGFMVLDAWARASNFVFRTKRYGDVAECSVTGRSVTLLKPSTYMNLSGNAVRFWLRKRGVPIEHLLVICDDLNLPFGTLRMRKKGSDGGHNGLLNIREMLGTEEYARIRIGIGNEFQQGEQVDFVLGDFPEEQAREIPELCTKVIEGIKTFVLEGPDRAMSTCNVRKKSTDNQA